MASSGISIKCSPYDSLGMQTDQYSLDAEIGVMGATLLPKLIMAYAGFIQLSTRFLT